MSPFSHRKTKFPHNYLKDIEIKSDFNAESENLFCKLNTRMKSTPSKYFLFFDRKEAFAKTKKWIFAVRGGTLSLFHFEKVK
jgi:hypothetical protein